MKKILFLLLIFVLKLSAYEYLIADNNNNVGSTGNILEIYYFNNENGKLNYKYIRNDGTITISDFAGQFTTTLGIIKTGTNKAYIRDTDFQDLYKNDLLFLNDLYLSNSKIAFLNYLYNDKNFSSANYINYENYELLYNSDGLAVESIVNGKWAGLYDDSGQSGNLFNEKGDLVYVNGVSASFFDRINEKLLRKFKINLESIFIKKIFYPLLVLIFVCVILRSVIRMAFQAFLIRFYDKKISQLEKRREKIENA